MLAEQKRFVRCFVPTQWSWLSPVEAFFADLTRKAICRAHGTWSPHSRIQSTSANGYTSCMPAARVAGVGRVDA